MIRFAIILPLALAACVTSERTEMENISGVVSGEPVIVDGVKLVADQMNVWPLMQPRVDAAGNTTVVEAGSGPTVIISGSPDDRDLAIRALAKFCGRSIDPAGFDTQYVYQNPKTGDWWFDGFCG